MMCNDEAFIQMLWRDPTFAVGYRDIMLAIKVNGFRLVSFAGDKLTLERVENFK